MQHTKQPFRAAQPEDVRKIKEIARQVITFNYTPFLGSEAVRDFITSGLSDKEIDDGLANCTLMIRNENIVGFSIVNNSLLHLIMISTPHQNKGFGSELLAHIESILFRQYETLRLQTFKENTPAVGFYLKNGWAIAEETIVPEIDKTMLSFEKRK